MTLTFFKNNKPDTRMIEYDQAVVRLGLEKAELEAEVEKKRREIKQMNVSLSLVRTAFLAEQKNLTEQQRKEVNERSSVLENYEKRVVEEKQKLDGVVAKTQEILSQLKEKEKEIVVLEDKIQQNNKEKEEAEESIITLQKEKKEAEQQKSIAVAEQNQAQNNLRKVSEEVKKLGTRNVEIKDELEKKNRELVELNEIISILQASNKQGLDITSSFEGERKRLQEKNEFLVRKEKDLLKYEQRVEKRAKELGVDIKMKFR
jgi:chromosome segregation ATPase